MWRFWPSWTGHENFLSCHMIQSQRSSWWLNKWRKMASTVWVPKLPYWETNALIGEMCHAYAPAAANQREASILASKHVFRHYRSSCTEVQVALVLDHPGGNDRVFVVFGYLHVFRTHNHWTGEWESTENEYLRWKRKRIAQKAVFLTCNYFNVEICSF